MKLRKSLLMVCSAAMVFAASAALISCGGNKGGDDGGDNGGNTDISALKDDLTYDEDGKIEFDNVELNIWSIIGDPDAAVQDKLIQKFNQEYLGLISINLRHIGENDYYNTLDQTWANEPEALPDVLFMHNERTAQYASKGYMYPLTDELLEKTQSKIDFSQAYENIDRVTKYEGTRYATPVDAHGFLTYFRQDIIKKNELGFEGNTRFVPESYKEYVDLLRALKAKADAGTLFVRNINKNEDHTWKKASANFVPSFTQSTDPDGFSSLYANGGTLMNEDQTKVVFHEAEGYQSYCKDMVNRWNEGLIGEKGVNTALYGAGDIAMFCEGPWWASQQYDPLFNNSSLLTVGEYGITQDDVDNYSKPFMAAHPNGWWTLDKNSGTANAKKWYGKGHAISISKSVKSLTTAAAAVEFMNWWTQGKDDSGKYYLPTWCTGGHIPAWKNVYASDEYKDIAKNNITLKALGDPNDIMTMEPIKYESTVFTGAQTGFNNIISALKGAGGCTEAQADTIIAEAGSSTQATLDLLNM